MLTGCAVPGADVRRGQSRLLIEKVCHDLPADRLVIGPASRIELLCLGIVGGQGRQVGDRRDVARLRFGQPRLVGRLGAAELQGGRCIGQIAVGQPVDHGLEAGDAAGIEVVAELGLLIGVVRRDLVHIDVDVFVVVADVLRRFQGLLALIIEGTKAHRERVDNGVDEVLGRAPALLLQLVVDRVEREPRLGGVVLQVVERSLILSIASFAGLIVLPSLS